jgi:hypothetical protein
MADALAAILATTEAERLATGFVFTEGPLWHPAVGGSRSSWIASRASA